MNRIRHWRGLRPLAGTLAVLVLNLLVPGLARAHNGEVHRDMTDLSYQVMRRVAFELNGEYPIARGAGITAVPPGVDPTEWATFLADIRVSVKKLAWLSDSPAPDPKIWTDYHPGGIYNEIRGTDLATVASFYSGRTLGSWAESIDSEDDDTHIWYRPTSMGVYGVLKGIFDKAFKAGVAAVLLPLVCIWDFFFGGGADCLKDTGDLASDADVVAKVEGLIPGIGDVSGDPYTTIWHFVNVQSSPFISNEYDDHQGLLYLEAAYHGPTPSFAASVDPLDFALLLLTSLTGMSIKYDDSNGPKRYEILGGNDAHPDTLHRTKGQWQFLPLGLTAIEPVDNLAKFGWDQFKGGYDRHFLGWPLHAIEDASEPHHAIGVTGWGHRPYEDAAAGAWHNIRTVATLGDGSDKAEYARDPSAGEVVAQADQAKRILLRAFAYRGIVKGYRAAHPELGMDVPIRDLVTQVAKETLAYSNASMSSDWWPFKEIVSTAYAAEDKAGFPGGKALGKASYEKDWLKARDLVELGCGGAVAFLMSSVEVMP
jgi:hypothetical protein